MELFLVVLGAVLATLGGFLNQAHQQSREQARDEERVLLEVNSLLLDYGAAVHELENVPEPPRSIEDVFAPTRLNAEMARIRDALYKAAIQLRSRERRSLAVRITGFALDSEDTVEADRYALLREVQLSLNEEMIREYESSRRPARNRAS